MPNEISTVRRSLAPTNFAEAMDFSRQLAKSDMVPAGFRNKPENILLAIQWGMEVGLGPMQALQSVAVINGKPSVYGDAALAMVRGAPVCEDVVERFEGSGDDLTAVCEAKRSGKSPVVAQFSVADAKKAALWNKPGPWQEYPRRMLQMRARGFALRDAFPDVLRGVTTAEEAADYPVNVHTGKAAPIDITPKRDLDAFAGGGQVVDTETGEVTEAPVTELARAAAAKGRDEFRYFLKTLTDEEFAVIRPLVGTRDAPGELTLLATRADEDRDPFGLPPLAATEPQGSPPAHGPAVFLADDTDDDLRVPLLPDADLPYVARTLLALIEAQPADERRIRLANAAAINRLATEAPDLHAQVQAALAAAGQRQPTLV